MNVAVQAQLPENLVKQAESFVNEGWAANLSDLMTEALRRYLETHQSEFIIQFIREDISWGLNGRDQINRLSPNRFPAPNPQRFP